MLTVPQTCPAVLTVSPNCANLSGITTFEPGESRGLFETVKQVAAAAVATPAASPFQYELLAAAAAHNMSILEPFDNDLATVIDACPGSHISYGAFGLSWTRAIVDSRYWEIVLSWIRLRGRLGRAIIRPAHHPARDNLADTRSSR